LGGKPVDPQAAAYLLQQLRTFLSDTDEGREILEQFERDPQEGAGRLAEYLGVRRQASDAGLDFLANDPKLSPSLRAEVYGGQVERIIQIASVGTLVVSPPARRRTWRFWAALAGAAVVLLGSGILLDVFILRIRPMAPGFNVAVAEFAEQDEQGNLRRTDQGMNFSLGLYNTIENGRKQRDPASQFDTRGPKEIGPILENDAEARDRRANEIAKQWKARVLIYGVITRANGQYQVAPSFFISDNELRYSSELTGANRLGKPVAADLTLPVDQIIKLNDRLYARIQALENIINGLASFYIGNYDQSVVSFDQAVKLPGWEETEGKEVAYILLGSARLRTFNPVSLDPSLLEKAQAAFNDAKRINPSYARAYLGLGSVTLAQANRFDPQQEARLYEARDWLKTALEMPNQPRSAYIALKANYELGQVYLVGSAQKYANFTREQAVQYFNQALAEYRAAGRPDDLAWYSANAHSSLGRIHGVNNQWDGMRDECRLAIQDLAPLNVQQSSYIALSTARAYDCAGYAEGMLNHPDQAKEEIQQAITIGGSSADPNELKEWQDHLSLFMKGTP
jgi:tetratricopeptide (TPR) repeat protein